MSDDDPTIVILAEHYGCVADILAERDRLRAVVDAAADGAGKTLAQVLADVMDERDRLREAQERERATADEARVARERAWLRIREIEAERDRLRAVVDALVAAAPLVPDEHGVYVNPLADALDVSPAMGDPSTAAELNRFSAEQAGVHYVTGVDPTSPTYDPDQYGGDHG